MILGEVEYTGYQTTDGRWVSSAEASSRDDVVAVNVAAGDVVEQKKGSGFVLRSDTNVTVTARAHKMSKSRGNVINPDDIVDSFGADSLRLYEMFMGPLRDTKTWSSKNVDGVHRFLARVWRMQQKPVCE